jgi:hypothetical protein
MEKLIREALREKCCELALYLHHGQTPAALIDEVAELASDRWALRSDEDA